MELPDFQMQMKEKTGQAEEVLKAFLPKEEGFQKEVINAMNYSLLAGGKRLRPIFMQEVYKMFGGDGKEIEAFMAAIEMIHTYSLVHDDLPAMDNDEYRRGRETTWKVYGEAMGVLAGDALLNYAFETALLSFELAPEKALLIAKALKVLFTKSGIYGMVGGQTLDVLAEEQNRALQMDELLFIHEYKTAALIQAAMMVGAILAGASDDEILKIEKCAYNIGIAFQIQDDILDVIGTTEELGKPVGSDAKNNKQTYVTINGLDDSKVAVENMSKEAVDLLELLPGDHEFLKALIINLIYRTK